ncbi:MAG: hypothetical protein ABMA14_18755 [Hyphomonadaceae bacterium]
MNTHVDELAFAPKKHFARPEDVLESEQLSYKDKRRILESWKHDEQRLAESTAENMTGGQETSLREVSRVLVQLKAMEEPPEAIQLSQTSHVVSGMTIGALVGAAAGLVATAVSAASLALVAQTAVAGLIIGGAVNALRKPAA